MLQSLWTLGRKKDILHKTEVKLSLLHRPIRGSVSAATEVRNMNQQSMKKGKPTIVPVAPIITGITFVFTFHMRCISIVRSLYFRIFSTYFLITFLSLEIVTSINIHVPFLLPWIVMSGLLLGIVLSVCTC